MSGYIGTQPVPQATQTRDAFTATAAQTSFATGGYTPGFLDVFLNGVKLAAADYTATNGSEVVLAVGAALNDIIEVIAYTTFETSKNATLAQGALADTALQPTGDGSGLTNLTSGNLVGALPAIDGSSLTGVGVTSALSSGQTVSAAGGLTVAHGLGVQPTKVWAYIQCTTADHGYSVGDKLYTAYSIRDTSANRSQGFSLVVDATNWVVRFADYTAPLANVVKSTGVAIYLTNASWQLYLGAET